MNTKINCGQVRGPVQIMFSRSLSPINPLDLAITRVAVTQEDTKKTTEMGRKAIVPYALYQGFGFFTPHYAKQTGFADEDFALFWEALQYAWDFDRSATRGMLSFRGAYIFSHNNPLGNAHAHKLFDMIEPELVEGVRTPRQFNHYTIKAKQELPRGVTLTVLE